MILPLRCGALALILALLNACASPALPRFEAALAAQDSATAALGQWCAARHLADPPTIRAERIADAAPNNAAVAFFLNQPVDGTISFRHVRLHCGDKVLSEAYNWYLPARLTPAMNEALRTTDTPFGKVILPPGFRRDRLTEERGRKAGCPKGTVLSHTAMLRLHHGQAISYLVECYTRANIE